MQKAEELPKGVIRHKGQIYAQFTDSTGKRRRLRARGVSDAEVMLSEQRIVKRHIETLPPAQRPTPASKQKRAIRFRDLANVALRHSEENNKRSTTDELMLKMTPLIRLAVENELLTVNPASFRRKRETRGRDRFLSQEDEVKLVEALRKNAPQHVPALLIALYTGIRAGEQFGLRWADVDFANRTVTLEQTKNGDVRYVRLSPTALTAFLELQDCRPSKDKDAFVFLSYKGTQLLDYRFWFNQAVIDAKIERIVWHSLRHTFASRLVMKGVDLRTVGKQLGHRTLQMTMRYSHLAKDHEQAAVDLLG